MLGLAVLQRSRLLPGEFIHPSHAIPPSGAEGKQLRPYSCGGRISATSLQWISQQSSRGCARWGSEKASCHDGGTLLSAWREGNGSGTLRASHSSQNLGIVLSCLVLNLGQQFCRSSLKNNLSVWYFMVFLTQWVQQASAKSHHLRHMMARRRLRRNLKVLRSQWWCLAAHQQKSQVPLIWISKLCILGAQLLRHRLHEMMQP